MAQWRLRQYKDAIQTAFKGQHLCASESHSNPRDCGMLVIVGALVVNSETLDRFEALKTQRHSGNLTREESADLAEKLPKTLAGSQVGSHLLRSGTSPLFHHGEAEEAESPRDFVHKLKVCLRSCENRNGRFG